MTYYQRAVIVGTGLLGGSIGLALRRLKLAAHVVGVGSRQSTLQAALDRGAVDSIELDYLRACQAADLVVICTPVQLVVGYIRQALAAGLTGEALITDVGSTKASICSSVPPECHSRFCGSHPMAGSDKSGVGHATAHLFVDRKAIITPVAQTSTQCTLRCEQFWQRLGCNTIRMSPQDHDQAVARISHLPHLIASALAAGTQSSLLPLASTGWSDTTRVAAGDVELWRQIVAENRIAILAALQDFSSSLQQWVQAIDGNDQERLVQLLALGRQQRLAVETPEAGRKANSG
jgi:prephenate dehydrogenase